MKRPDSTIAPKEEQLQLYCYYIFESLGPGRTVNHLLTKLEDLKTLPQVPTIASLYNWRNQFHWDERAMLFDAEQEKARRELMTQEFTEMNQRHITIAKAGQALAMKRISELANAGRISAHAAVLLLKTCFDIERAARFSLPPEMKDETHEEANVMTIDVSALSNDTLAAIINDIQKSRDVNNE